MSFAHVHGVVVHGVSGALIRVEAEVTDGLPSVGVVGLPDTAVNESRWRVRSAVTSAGLAWPTRRVTLNLAPAEIPKQGSGLDLPIAISVLAANGALEGVDLADIAFLGELGLDGSVRATRGALAAALAVTRAGIARVVVAAAGSAGLERVPGLRVLRASTLAGVISVLHGAPDEPPGDVEIEPPSAAEPDLADVRGNEHARFALEVAAAGGHHIALVGQPGVGKTMLAERLPSLLPDLDDDEAIEVAAIHSVAGADRADFRRPPFRAPHHSASSAALLGAAHGHRVRPGAVTLAHRGVLFMDEAPEFSRPCLEGLRQPLESGRLALHRAGWSGVLPAAFQLVLAANPCPCGFRGGTAGGGRGGNCSCGVQAIRRYAARLSGPLLDRVDIRVAVGRAPVGPKTAAAPPVGEASSAVAQRVHAARLRARRRLGGTPWSINGQVPGSELRGRWMPDAAGLALLDDLERSTLSLRGVDRVLRVAWTIADLGAHDRPSRDDVAAALSLRGSSLQWAA